MIDLRKINLRKVEALERAGFADAARHMRRWARLLGIPLPPRDHTVELPALFTEADDLDALGVEWRRADGGVLITVPRRGGR